MIAVKASILMLQDPTPDSGPMAGRTPRRWILGLALLTALSMLPSATAQGGGSTQLSSSGVAAPDALPGVYEVPLEVIVQFPMGMCACTEVQIDFFAQEDAWKNRTSFQPASLIVPYDPVETVPGQAIREHVQVQIAAPADMAGQPPTRVTLDAQATTDGPTSMQVAPTQITLEFPDLADPALASNAAGSGDGAPGEGEEDPAEASAIPSVALPGVVLALSLVALVARRRTLG